MIFRFRVRRLVSRTPRAFLFMLMLVGVTACGENGGPAESAVEHAGRHLEVTYVCPMHPNIVKTEPGQSCPICGMDLVEREVKPTLDDLPAIELSADVLQRLGVRSAQVSRGKLFKFIRTVGYVGYNEDRYKIVSMRMDGWVENLAVRAKGWTVKRGQLLFEFYSPEFQRLQSEFLATQKQDKSGIRQRYGQRRESVESRDRLRYLEVPDSTLNRIARTGKALHRLPIYAPVAGRVLEHNVHKNQFVYADEEIMTIADTSTVWVEANVYEHQLEWLRLGLEAEVNVKALPGRKYKGEVNYINPELDPKTRTLVVRLRVPNVDDGLKPNMFAEVKIFGGPKEDVLSVPREALIITGERESVIIDQGDGHFRPRTVSAGMRSGGSVEILSGLEEGERVVVSGQFLLDSEANLRASFRRLGAGE